MGDDITSKPKESAEGYDDDEALLIEELERRQGDHDRLQRGTREGLQDGNECSSVCLGRLDAEGQLLEEVGNLWEPNEETEEEDVRSTIT